MFGIGMPELIIILVIILIIFGAGKLPEIGAGMGKAIRNFKGASDEEEKKTPDKIEEEKKPWYDAKPLDPELFDRKPVKAVKNQTSRKS